DRDPLDRSCCCWRAGNAAATTASTLRFHDCRCAPHGNGEHTCDPRLGHHSLQNVRSAVRIPTVMIAPTCENLCEFRTATVLHTPALRAPRSRLSIVPPPSDHTSAGCLSAHRSG